MFKVVLKAEEPPAPTVRRFSYSDLRKLLEIELKEADCDAQSVYNILNLQRTEPLTKQERQKLDQVLEGFAKEHRSFIRDLLKL